MNGSWYPWGVGVNGNQPGQFAAAWQHVHNIFVQQDATNVKWIWAPLANFTTDPSLYPGNPYVDIIGFSGFNDGALAGWGGWRTFSQIYDRSLAGVQGTGKPVEISEFAVANQGRTAEPK